MTELQNVRVGIGKDINVIVLYHFIPEFACSH